VRHRTKVYAKDDLAADELAKNMLAKGREPMIAEVQKQSEKDPELKPIFEAMRDVSFLAGTRDAAATVDGKATPEAIIGFIKWRLLAQGDKPKPDR
jgi:hypothetical protein